MDRRAENHFQNPGSSPEPVQEPIPVLRDEGGWVAVAKPAGLTVHEAPGPSRSVLRVLREERGWTGLIPVHRLDKDVSGVLLLARSAGVAGDLQRGWALTGKTYRALCRGLPGEKEGSIEAPLLEHQTGRPERMWRAVRYFERQNPGQAIPPLPFPKTTAVHPAGRYSRTDFFLESAFFFPSGARFSWLTLHPRQGRMHQIRVHLAHAAFPLACDPLYGPSASLDGRELEPSLAGQILLSRLSLHAWRLVLPGTVPGHPLAIEAPWPADLWALKETMEKTGSRIPV